MKILLKTLLFSTLFFLNNTLIAQDLNEPFFRFSGKKIAYITLKDGKQVKGYIKDIDRKKGLIEEIKIKDLKGKKRKYKPEDIKFMYLPPSGFEKFGRTLAFLEDATKWKSTALDKDIIGKGYVYFETTEVVRKKKQRTLLAQLLNPAFADKIKIYFDPYAKESASLGFGGIKVAGGHAKSYYIKYDDIAYRIKKKDYDEEFKMIFQSCPSIVKKYGDDPKWTKLGEHVFEATDCPE